MPKRFNPTAPIVAGVGFGVAAGVALGAFGVGPVVGNHLGGGDTSEGAVREEYRKSVQASQVLEAQIKSGDSIISEMAPTTVDGSLSQRPVLVMKTSNAADADVQAIQSLLKSADAIDAGTISLANNFFRQEGADTLKSLVTNTLPAGTQLSTKTATVGMHAGQALGAALLMDAESAEPLAQTKERATMLQALRDKGLIDYAEGTILPAQAVVVVDGKTDGLGTSAFKADNLVDFVKGLDEAGGSTVLAAPIENTAEKGPIGILRSTADNKVSTVDSINRAWARMAAVMAVKEQLDGGLGAYGSAASAEAAAPAPSQQ